VGKSRLYCPTKYILFLSQALLTRAKGRCLNTRQPEQAVNRRLQQVYQFSKPITAQYAVADSGLMCKTHHLNLAARYPDTDVWSRFDHRD